MCAITNQDVIESESGLYRLLGDLDLAWNALEDVVKYIAGALELRVFKRRPSSRYTDHRLIYETRVQECAQVMSSNT